MMSLCPANRKCLGLEFWIGEEVVQDGAIGTSSTSAAFRLASHVARYCRFWLHVAVDVGSEDFDEQLFVQRPQVCILWISLFQSDEQLMEKKKVERFEDYKLAGFAFRLDPFNNEFLVRGCDDHV